MPCVPLNACSTLNALYTIIAVGPLSVCVYVMPKYFYTFNSMTLSFEQNIHRGHGVILFVLL